MTKDSSIDEKVAIDEAATAYFVTASDSACDIGINMLVVLTTAPDVWEAESLAEKLVKERLAACVQVLPQMTSFYFWEGEVQKEGEHLLLIKTIEAKYDAVMQFIRQNHSYEVPEIIALKSDEASGPYVDWLNSYINGATE